MEETSTEKDQNVEMRSSCTEEEKSEFVGKDKQEKKVEHSNASLPRVSKTNHKIIPESSRKETENPGTLGKSSCKSSQ